jgi:serine phosphatase RsbU (regulator of sigma subunit)
VKGAARPQTPGRADESEAEPSRSRSNASPSTRASDDTQSNQSPDLETESSPSARPRALVVGDLPGIRSRAQLEATLDLRSSTVDQSISRLANRRFDIVLLDGTLPRDRLEAVLQALGPVGGGERPAVVVVTATAVQPAFDRRLLGDAADFATGGLGESELLGRVQATLRFRCCLAELSRKNGELEALYARVDSMARRMAEELRLASNVQRSLLPPPLNHPRLDLAREFIPFREIGGDYYDFVPMGRNRLVFTIGDVMGKGVPAALLAANLKASLRAQLQASEDPPEDVVTRVNRLFWEVTPKGLFASLFFGVLDLEEGTLEYVNAGHDYPFHVRPSGRLEDLREGGTVLGLMEASAYERGRIAFQSGDLLIFYSDGLVDRSNADGEMYGPERLKEAAIRCRRDGARITLYTLLGEAQGWSGGRSPEDDITLVVIKIR